MLRGWGVPILRVNTVGLFSSGFNYCVYPKYYKERPEQIVEPQIR